MKTRLFSRKSNTIKNVFKSSFSKKVLLSYIKSPFEQNNPSLVHNNIIESIMIAEAFNENSYIVDVVDYNEISDANINDYSVIFGFGETLEKSFSLPAWKGKRLCYCTGSNDEFNNEVSINKLKKIVEKYNTVPVNGFRFVNQIYPLQVFSPDKLIVLGNEITLDTFSNKTIKKGISINAPFIDLKIDSELKKWDNKNENSFLYFSGSGSFHKGLDEVIEVFSQNKDFSIHLVGPFEFESDFMRIYKDQISSCSNIHSHGFLDIESDELKKILCSTKYLISNSIAEGQSTSVLNACANGDLIPIINKRNGISLTIDEGVLIDDYNDLKEAIMKTKTLSNNLQKSMSLKFSENLKKNYSQNKFKQNIKSLIQEI